LNPAALTIDGVTKRYGGLRPLRITALTIQSNERVGLVGFDQASAEMFVNLVTGTTLPEEGRITAFGQATSDIPDSAAWMQFADRFGIVSERAVLLEPLTALQNLAMPFTLSIEPGPDDVRPRAEALLREIGIDAKAWSAAVSGFDAAMKMRLRIGRALALEPAMLLLEHASAGLPAADAAALARDIAAIADRRGVAATILTADEAFARASAQRVLRWDPASGRLAERRGWFSGRLG